MNVFTQCKGEKCEGYIHLKENQENLREILIIVENG